MQLSMQVANDKFGRSDFGEDKTKIVLASSISKKSTVAGYLTSSIKKCDQAA